MGSCSGKQLSPRKDRDKLRKAPDKQGRKGRAVFALGFRGFFSVRSLCLTQAGEKL